MMKINKVIFNGETVELAIPVYLSDDEVSFAKKKHDSDRTAALANAAFVFSIIQEQIKQFMTDKEMRNKNE